MSKKSLHMFCFSCDLEYTVKVDEENTKVEPEFCPFCGEVIDTEESDLDESEDSDVEVEDEWG